MKRLEYLRGFLRFCKDSSWIDTNAAMLIKPPKVGHRPTLPFDESEMDRILKAADGVSSWGSFGPKARAMVLLLRYSGLRMQDAACIERARLNNGRIFLYTQKTGTPVYCPLPADVNTALERVTNRTLITSFGTVSANAKRPLRAGIVSLENCLRRPTHPSDQVTRIDSETRLRFRCC